ncbi:MAG TPA: hypothetical protein VMV72_15230 [Verrucomicrobiae bacterium]|nr:hypothetical protein [Verrucomicrobiae bacterium]
MSATPQDENVIPDAGKNIVCLGCARLVPANADFCPHCGAPLSSTSTIDPYKSIFAEGQMYWRLTHAPLSPMAVAGLSVMLCFSILSAVGATVEAIRDTNKDVGERALYFVYGVVGAAISVALWVRICQNFRRQRTPTHGQHERPRT